MGAKRLELHFRHKAQTEKCKLHVNCRRYEAAIHIAWSVGKQSTGKVHYLSRVPVRIELALPICADRNLRFYCMVCCSQILSRSSNNIIKNVSLSNVVRMTWASLL
jgi:hypothetical protein